jgi:hypothetical protein
MTDPMQGMKQFELGTNGKDERSIRLSEHSVGTAVCYSLAHGMPSKRFEQLILI